MLSPWLWSRMTESFRNIKKWIVWQHFDGRRFLISISLALLPLERCVESLGRFRSTNACEYSPITHTPPPPSPSASEEPAREWGERRRERRKWILCLFGRVTRHTRARLTRESFLPSHSRVPGTRELNALVRMFNSIIRNLITIGLGRPKNESYRNWNEERGFFVRSIGISELIPIRELYCGKLYIIGKTNVLPIMGIFFQKRRSLTRLRLRLVRIALAFSHQYYQSWLIRYFNKFP